MLSMLSSNVKVHVTFSDGQFIDFLFYSHLTDVSARVVRLIEEELHYNHAPNVYQTKVNITWNSSWNRTQE